MSKKNRKRSPEIPQVGNALEVPNYVVPMTDLEYKIRGKYLGLKPPRR